MTMPIPKTPEIDEKRKAMIEAARAYDEVQRELTSLRDRLHTAVAGLEAKNSEIDELRKMMEHQRIELSDLLTQERANVAIAHEARDRAYAERADALAWLSAVEAVIGRARDESALQSVKANGGGVGVIVGGSGGAAAGSTGPSHGALPVGHGGGDLFIDAGGGSGPVPDAGGDEAR